MSKVKHYTLFGTSKLLKLICIILHFLVQTSYPHSLWNTHIEKNSNELQILQHNPKFFMSLAHSGFYQPLCVAILFVGIFLLASYGFVSLTIPPIFANKFGNMR